MFRLFCYAVLIQFWMGGFIFSLVYDFRLLTKDGVNAFFEKT